jgi:hypothetical protein
MARSTYSGPIYTEIKFTQFLLQTEIQVSSVPADVPRLIRQLDEHDLSIMCPFDVFYSNK